jgi:hypothetical protein
MNDMRTFFALATLTAAALVARAAKAEQLPFSNVGPSRPAVSPYLNLLTPNAPGVSNYHTLVRPQFQQREEQLRQQAQIRQIQRQVERGQPGGVPIRGSQEIRATGHETAFMNYLHYYPVRR